MWVLYGTVILCQYLFILFIVFHVAAETAQELTATEARAIAKEAYIYGFPIVDNYSIQ